MASVAGLPNMHLPPDLAAHETPSSGSRSQLPLATITTLSGQKITASPGKDPPQPPGQPPDATNSPRRALRRGFFDSGSRRKASISHSSNVTPAVSIVGGKAAAAAASLPAQLQRDLQQCRGGGAGNGTFDGSGGESGSSLPCLHIVPEATQRQQDAAATMRALAPSPQLMEAMLAQPQLLALFDDPEVMAAVNDLAHHPEHLVKYSHSPKVAEFFRRMNAFAAQQRNPQAAAS